MIFLYIRFKVKDYGQWKSLFDAGESPRLNSGIELRKVFRSINEPNEVSLLLEAANREKVNEFLKSEYLKKRMNKAGVVNIPEIHYLRLA